MHIFGYTAQSVVQMNYTSHMTTIITICLSIDTQMNNIRKPQIINFNKEEYSQQKFQTPGPGSYQVALPLIRPNYQAIRKKNDVVILKINHHGESSNFRSQQERFADEKDKSPGPGHYHNFSLNLRKKEVSAKKYSQRYTDLIEFMYRDRIHMSPIPDYQVTYEDNYEEELKRIKNSHRNRKHKQKNSKEIKAQEKVRKSSICSTNNIVNIRSSSRLSMMLSQDSRIESQRRENGDGKEESKSELRTIDFPGQPSNTTSKKRPFPLEKEEKLLLHRVTLYNRNMLGMLMVKNGRKKENGEKGAKKDDDSTIEAN